LLKGKSIRERGGSCCIVFWVTGGGFLLDLRLLSLRLLYSKNSWLFTNRKIFWYGYVGRAAIR